MQPRPKLDNEPSSASHYHTPECLPRHSLLAVCLSIAFVLPAGALFPVSRSTSGSGVNPSGTALVVSEALSSFLGHRCFCFFRSLSATAADSEHSTHTAEHEYLRRKFVAPPIVDDPPYYRHTNVVGKINPQLPTAGRCWFCRNSMHVVQSKASVLRPTSKRTNTSTAAARNLLGMLTF